MADTAVGRRDDRLALAERLERAQHDAVTAALFADESPYRPDGPSLLGDLWRASRTHEPEHGVARERLARAPAPTVSTDVPGVRGTPVSPPGWVVEVARRRQAGAVALIEALRTVELGTGGLPWVPTPTAAQAAPTITAEKTEVASRALSVGGGFKTPVVIARAADVAWQVQHGASDAVLALFAEDVYAGLAAWLLGELRTAAGTAQTDFGAALSAVEAAGFAPDVLVTSAAGLLALGLPSNFAADAGLDVVVGPTGGDTFVVARAGVWCATSDTLTYTVAEPQLGGYEVGVAAGIVCDVNAGAVEYVEGSTP